MAKTQKVELYRHVGSDTCNLMFFFGDGDFGGGNFIWSNFKVANPVISRGMREGQNRILKRTQLKKGFKLELM